MKKILFGLFALLAMTLVSCDNKAGLPGPGDPVNVAAAAAGTYNGTWTRTLASNPDNPQVEDGTLVITQVGDEFYVVNVVAKCAGIGLDGQANANINPRYVFFNAVKSDFGNEFNGKIVDGNTATMSFSLTVTEGRKQNVYSYEFNGTKSGAAAPEVGPAL